MFHLFCFERCVLKKFICKHNWLQLYSFINSQSRWKPCDCMRKYIERKNIYIYELNVRHSTRWKNQSIKPWIDLDTKMTWMQQLLFKEIHIFISSNWNVCASKCFRLNEFHALASTERKATFHNYNNSRWYTSNKQHLLFNFTECIKMCLSFTRIRRQKQPVALHT